MSEYPFYFQKRVVRDYLFSEKTQKQVGKDHNVTSSSVGKWLKNMEILRSIAGERDITFTEVKKIKEEKMHKVYATRAIASTRAYPPHFKKDVVRDYLFSEKTQKQVGKDHKVSNRSVGIWSEDNEILKSIAEEEGIDIEKLKKLKDKKTEMYTDKRNIDLPVKVEACIDYIENGSMRDVEKKKKVSRQSISNWLGKLDIRGAMSKNMNVSSSRLGKIIDEKLESYRAWDIETRINVCLDYFLSDKLFKEFEIEYEIPVNTIKSWSRNPRILKEIIDRIGIEEKFKKNDLENLGIKKSKKFLDRLFFTGMIYSDKGNYYLKKD